MSRSQDTVIDDDEETCPLCIEEFDLSDKNFRPCPCGYQICQFCFNSLKTTYEKSTCPNCRRPYDEKTIQYKIPTAEEFKLDQLNKNKKQAAARRKETEKREVETSSRRNLAGVRVKQQNLVYVIGLIPQVKDEQALLQTLRGPDYFGQYGEIEKIVVSKPKPGTTSQGIGVYVTYARKEDAALCINTVDGSLNGDRVLRAQFGTTKYCSAFLRGEVCSNKSCSFLHETGEEGQNSSLQNEPHNTKPKPATSQIAPPVRPLSATQTTQPMARQGSKEDDISRKNSHDASALPSTASWANANAPVARTRGASQANSRGTPSPQMSQAPLAAPKPEEPKPKEPASQPTSTSTSTSKTSTSQSELAIPKPRSKPVDHVQQQFDAVLRSVSPHFRFVYDDSCLSPEVRATIDDMPPLIDPYGGAKRRAMRDREETERAKLEAEAKAKLEAQAILTAEDALEEDNIVAGSLALGGEPEDDPSTSSARAAISRPSQGMSDTTRSLTPQQRQQLAFLNTGSSQAPSLGQNTAFEMSDFDRQGPQYSQAQFEQINAHQRHGSRYFNNDSKANSANNANRFQANQSTFYSSGVQGPPPGLPTAGTPPVSGGGMFAHGQNFTNPGFGSSKDSNAEIFSRNRSGTNQGHDMSKRGGVEHLADPSIVSARSHQGNTTGQGLFGGQQVDETNFPPLPVRSDIQLTPLHSRVSSHHSFGSGIRSSTPKIPPGFERTSTPKIPPGFELLHGHPPPSRHDTPGTPGVQTPANRNMSTASTAIAPAVPLLPLGPRSSTPKTKPSKTPKEDTEPLDDSDKAGLQIRKTRTDASEISLGSPKLRASRSKNDINKPRGMSEKAEENSTKTDKPASTITDTKAKAKAGEQRPEKIAIPPPPTAVSAVFPSEKSATPILDSNIVGTPGPMSSRPATPAATTPSEAPKATMAKPRTLRLTTGTITKAAESTPVSATPEKLSGFPPLSSLSAKKGSRRPSLSSAQHSRPSTPAISEQPSQDVSRASSPPPSIVGSAPDRIKTKAQQKKDRKDKAKKSEISESAGTPTTAIVEEVAPVIARQKKQKKKVDTSTAQSADETASPRLQAHAEDQRAESTARKASTKALDKDQGSKPAQAEKSASPAPATPKEETPPPKAEDRAKAPYTLRDLYNEAGKAVEHADTTIAIQKLLSEHVSSMPKIISSLIQSGDLSKDHPWLNPPNFSSAAYKLAPDSRRGQEYLDGNGYAANDAFGYVYLPLKEKQALRDGQAVSIADGGECKDELLRRCLVTPNGWVLRHLSADEVEKVLDLEERRQMYMEEFGEVGTMDGLGVLEADDYTNLGGGMDRLSRHGERHGVVWVMGDGHSDDDGFDMYDREEGEIDGEIGFSDDDEGEFDEDLLDDEAGDGFYEAVNMPGAWDNPPRSASGRVTSLPGLGPHSKTTTPLRMPGQVGAPSAPTGQQPQPKENVDRNVDVDDNVNVNVNLRALESDVLQKRVVEKQKELEQARKEMEKIEKLWTKKSKDIGRWREGLVKG
ncbi:transcriptional repressor general negative regulator of transcription subunit 4 [Exophiala xenobiotica]|uniref:Transcriptional repressor general negative regulator of transcription subunit 4 n=1 Tax=Vermiconidia calcicola TaxID=1690605 RepID=A0AAV9QA15_9PEZI|nr:transcriptional repressor general negative regulator of transcription subunit 4 [Exophiala xenobiotica]KAK5430600.1 transcriptional repressor general negative regulator of transcription subunit 4 [Exophiala xenobiotica]KAK5537442.1 transcriptional repressor general negative regulator of transcription subunit 4 [Vermiconidia calcicola]KAK5539316.1 transcriptional repressor general negative regulator of transcription subunit 4 [Chaetothyriales sp. CCFEE 6169]